MVALAATLGLSGLGANPAFANNPPPPITLPTPGQTVVNPDTGNNETVQTDQFPYVITTEGNAILMANVVGQTFTQSGVNYTVTAISGTTVSLQDGGGNNSSTDFVTHVAAATPGGAPQTVSFPSPGGGQNPYRDVQHGGNGGNGSAGALFWSAGDGGGGSNGPAVTDQISGGTISTTDNGLDGVIIQSIGGNGGKGGDGYLGASGGTGGTAGAGGSVTFQQGDAVTTTGNNSIGVLVTSSSGKGGDGGTGFLFSSGGSGGGSPGLGGDASATNTGSIGTSGIGSIGLYVESLGGSAGDGGGSYGIVASGGGGSFGGTGGTATANQQGTVFTSGELATGVLAQSIGGSGGNGGTSGGLVGLGAGGGGGGNGGSAIITTDAYSSTKTTGLLSNALMAQSIGGGGGTGSLAVCLFVLGGIG